MIADEKISEIRERTDIVALVGEYVSLRRVGHSFRGLCPFHAEKTPSFYVHPTRQYYHCFGCQASGDAISFLTQIEGRSFAEAVRALGDRAGVEVEEAHPRDRSRARESKVRAERLASVMEAATAFYMQQLREHPLAVHARDELAKRQIADSVASSFRLGYAPHGWDALSSFLQKRGHSNSDAEALGLIVARTRGTQGGHYDRFRHRLMFPISDLHGRVVAFSGRALPEPSGAVSRDGEPPAKYINSPEGPLYKKGDTLFGMHESRVMARREGWVLICEGNFDLVALHQGGFGNAVAPMGTAFTASQARVLRRYVERVVFLFDGDRAGRKAVRAAYGILDEAGLEARVVTLPDGHDPDTFLRERGAESLRHMIEQAPHAMSWLIDDAADSAGGDPSGKAKAIESLGPVMQRVKNPVEARVYLERIMTKFHVHDVQAVRKQLIRGLRTAGAQNRDARRDSTGTAERPSEAEAIAKNKADQTTGRDDAALPALERELLGALLDQPTLFSTAEAKKIEELLTAAGLRAIFRLSAEMVTNRGSIDVSTLIEGVGDAPGSGWLKERLSVEKYQLAEAEDTLRRGLQMLLKQKIERERFLLAQEIQAARRIGDEQRAQMLTKQRDELFRGAQKTG